jgi:hypothetical protein
MFAHESLHRSSGKVLAVNPNPVIVSADKVDPPVGIAICEIT